MKINDIEILNANSTDEIKQKLSQSGASTITPEKIRELILQAKNIGYAQGFSEAQKMYQIDVNGIDNMMKGL